MRASPPAAAARSPILVTGMPRSGTTWLARLFATASGTALPGREPMNPHPGQYGLARTLTRWAALAAPTPRQRRALRMAYRGSAVRLFGRYGRRQWAAPLPWTRVVIKDPFAMLSIPTVVDITSATPVLLYRHPAAALASYRRMGWRPDLAELRPILAAHRAAHGRRGPTLPDIDDVDSVDAMALFWSGLYEIALDITADVSACLVVAHEELARGGPKAAQQLFALIGLKWTDRSETEFRAGAEGSGEVRTEALHNFDRSAEEAAAGWRRHITDAEIERMELLTEPVRTRLENRRYDLTN